jgi:hypothetical protein
MAGFEDAGYRVDLATGTSGGGVVSLANTFGRAVVVTGLALNLTTASTGAGTVDAGIAAAATTSSDNLIDGASTATIAVLNNGVNAGTNGKSAVTWKTDQFLTVSQASGAVAGLVGEAVIKFYPV